MKISSSYKVKFVVLNIICTILVSGIVAFFGVRGMNEQAAGTEEILNMMKVLSENSTEMSSTSQMMSQKTEKIVSGVSEISRSSDDILKSTGNAAGQLAQIKDFAEKSSESSLANEDAAASVKKIVESYKV